MRTYKAYIGLAVVALAAVLCFGCGDASRNDQGVSFNLTGYFADSGGDTGVSAISVPLNSNPSVSTDTEASGQSGAVTWSMSLEVYAGLENHLSGQYVRAQRMHHSYYIPGATVQPPSTSVAIPVLLGPATLEDGSTTSSNSGSSLPDTYTNDSTGYVGLNLVTSDVVAWINFYRDELPETPFVMVVTSYASAVTSSGTEIESNPVEIEITFTTDEIISPTTSTSGSSDSSSESTSE